MKALAQSVHSSLLNDGTSVEQHWKVGKSSESSTVLVQLIPLPEGGADSAALLTLLPLFEVA